MASNAYGDCRTASCQTECVAVGHGHSQSGVKASDLKASNRSTLDARLHVQLAEAQVDRDLQRTA